MNTECDVLVIGAGMAGSCIAMQMKTNFPDLDVTLIEKKEDFEYWVGESTVEMWDDYMTRVLGLGPYLEKHTMQKHGLRFYFDNEDKSLDIEQMSEMGRSKYHSIPARQIDRKKFDTDMLQINKDRGVDVRQGVGVLSGNLHDEPIALNGEDGHVVQTNDGAIKCKWLIDAGGMRSPLSNKLDLRVKNTKLKKGSYWSRYSHTANIDDLGSNAWNKRVRYTQRHLSTNHFMYRGYWIWFIVIDTEVASIGVEFDREQVQLKFKNGEEFDEWLRSHRSIDQVLGPRSNQLDFYGLMNIAYTSKQFMSEDRWFVTGMSGAFSSVLGSSTSRAYSTSNILIEEIIRSDINGNKDEVKRLVKNINEQLDSNYESSVRFLSNLDRNGSFETWYPFFNASLALYFNSSLPAATNMFSKELTMAKTNEMAGMMCWKNSEQVKLRIRIAQYADEFKEFLDGKGVFYSGNVGQFNSSNAWEEYPPIDDKIYDKRDPEAELMISKEVYHYLVECYVGMMCDYSDIDYDAQYFAMIFDGDWNSDRDLSYYVDRIMSRKQIQQRPVEPAVSAMSN